MLIIASALAADAFAVAVCLGLAGRPSFRKMLVVGLYFGAFQAVMPLVGFFAGFGLTGFIAEIDHWIAFGVMAFLGVKMILGGVKKDEGEGLADKGVGPGIMLPLAFATSIDALAAGLGFAFMNVNILQTIVIIGVVTFVLSSAGVWAGSAFGTKSFGTKYKARAEITGGLVLVAMGVRIVIVHYM